METFIAVLHIVVAFILIGLVLIQDTKSGSLGGAFGGGGSNSVLGATGAATLAQKLTRWTAVIFAITSIVLSIFSVQKNKDLLSNTVLPPVKQEAAPTTNTKAPTPTDATSSQQPATTAPSQP